MYPEFCKHCGYEIFYDLGYWTHEGQYIYCKSPLGERLQTRAELEEAPE